MDVSRFIEVILDCLKSINPSTFVKIFFLQNLFCMVYIGMMYLTDYGSMDCRLMEHVICKFDCNKNNAIDILCHCKSP